MEIFKKYIRIPKQKITQTTPNHIINIKSTGSTKNYIAYGAKLLINEKLNKIVLKASGNATNKALITADVLMKKIKGLAQINEIKSEEIVDEYQGKTPDLEPLSIKKNLALLEISLSLETNIDKTHYGYQAPLPEEKIKEFGTSFLPKEGNSCILFISYFFIRKKRKK